MLGKGFVVISFSGIYIYTSELFPTPVRSAAMGTAVLAARIGGLVAPLMGVPMVRYRKQDSVDGFLSQCPADLYSRKRNVQRSNMVADVHHDSKQEPDRSF